LLEAPLNAAAIPFERCPSASSVLPCWYIDALSTSILTTLVVHPCGSMPPVTSASACCFDAAWKNDCSTHCISCCRL
jgi:hypothetical protein